MTPFEQREALCQEYDVADRLHREALNTVTAQMRIGARGNPSMQDLEIWEIARERLEDLQRRMNDLIRATFGE